MIEDNETPAAACRYCILPFDKVGKDPSECNGKGPISLPSSYMKLLEAIVVQRLKTTVGPILTDKQYAYQRRRSAEILLADSDSIDGDSLSSGRPVYIVGLDIEGAFV